MDRKLNFVNRTDDANNTSYVLFQRNIARDFIDIAVAWTVIENCGRGDNYSFTFPEAVEVAAADSDGNVSERLGAKRGESFSLVQSPAGLILEKNGAAPSPREIEIINELSRGGVTAYCYRDGKVVALRSDLAPGQKALFEFKPTVWIGAAKGITQGEVIHPDILGVFNTEISLLELASADIVATGGGAGPDAQPIFFRLENIEYNLRTKETKVSNK